MGARLVVVGGGRMGTALVGGLVAAGWDPGTVTVVEADADRRADLVGIIPGVEVVTEAVSAVSVDAGVSAVSADDGVSAVSADDGVSAVSADDGVGAVVAVKPVDAEAACRSLAGGGVGRVLSIMAGVRLASLEAWLGAEVAVVRAMPNTPALVGAGVSALAGGSRAGEDDLAWAEEILGAVGRVVRLSEPSLDAATGLSGSGPAYIFLVAEALVDAGVGVGLTPEVSRTLVLETIAGAARLLLETGEEPETLRAQVTSPGGTTEAGVARLEANGLRRAFEEAVRAATERSRALSGS